MTGGRSTVFAQQMANSHETFSNCRPIKSERGKEGTTDIENFAQNETTAQNTEKTYKI